MRKFIVIAGNNQALVKKALQKRGNWEDITEERADGDFDNVHFIWKPTNLPIRAYAKMDSNPPSSDSPQIFNHFEVNNGICTKTGLIRSLRTYYYSTEQALMHKYTVFESTPTTFLITAADENQEYVNFIARFRDITKRQFTKEHVPEKHCQENLWLIKPANQNQGRGIEIFNNLKDIQNFISSQTAHSYWVAQKYIERPLLFFGRKFDIRQWVVVTSKLEIFFYRTAYMRTSSDTYKTDAFDNYIHLTNNCLQKHGENFGKFESGNTLPLDALQDYFNEVFPQHGLNVAKHIIPRMKDLIIDTILSVKKSLNPKRRKNCFELFGYDFLIDEDFRTWLLEVNTNPYLGVPNEFIKNLLPEMMDDVLKIALDPIYPPTNPEALADRENHFELIYCEYHSSHHEGPLNVRSPFCDNLYPIPSVAPVLRHVRPAQAGDKENNKTTFSREVKDLTSSNLLLKQQQQSDKEGHEIVISKIKLKQDSAGPTPVNKKNKTGKATTIILPENIDVQRAPSPQSGREKRGSLGPPTQQQEKVFNHNTIAETSKKIDMLLENYSVLDNEMLMPLVLRLMSVLKNWELQSNNEISTACKAITTISESRVCGVLTDINCVTQMINLLDSQDVPLKIQVTLIKGFLNICKIKSEKKKIVCDKMIHALIRLTFACCDSVQIKNYDPQIIKLAIKCLGVLSGKYDRKMYVPGETLVEDKVRDFLINQGGLLALLMVSKLSLDEEIEKMPEHHCFRYLTISDWELQKTVLEGLKDEKGQIVTKETPEDLDKIKGNLSFLFAASSPNGAKLENKRLTDSTYYLGPVINPNIPKYLLERSDYTVENMTRDVIDKISTLKEEKQKLEQEEEERKGQFLQEQLKEQQQREIMALERKKKAEELFLKRLEERKKQQEEITKKMEEETKARRQQEEDLRKMKMQELVKKKEEYEKKTKLMEVKKKKMEDDMRKLMEEEVEKKKAQRKALEESFWIRVRGKPKERPQERESHQARKEDIGQNSMERAPSVEPSIIQDGPGTGTNTEKSKLLRTNTLGSPYNFGSEARSNTFSNFFKEDSLTKTTSSPANSQIHEGKGARQRSVEEGRNRKKDREKETMVLPYIDIQSSQKMNSKISFEKMSKGLKQSNLFTLNEAEEEVTSFADDRASNPLFKQLFKQPNTVRHEDGEKLKKMMLSSENIRPKNLVHLKEIVQDKLKEQEKDKEKDKTKEMKEIVAKHKEASFGGLRHISPQNLSEYAHTTMYKAYIAKRKVKLQPTHPKSKES